MNAKLQNNSLENDFRHRRQQFIALIERQTPIYNEPFMLTNR
jgi:hypothetical protein